LKGAKIRVHAKIESVEALMNLDEIIKEADGVHVSRGDLGMELPLSKLAVAQKAIIHAANVAGKPVVTSTQTLQSMVENPRPTNAECTDVANAVLGALARVWVCGVWAQG
jgi:pyruvate kinase